MYARWCTLAGNAVDPPHWERDRCPEGPCQGCGLRSPGRRDCMGSDREDERAAYERRRRRAIFLRELAEARELRKRVAPRRSRRERLHAALRMRTFRL